MFASFISSSSLLSPTHFASPSSPNELDSLESRENHPLSVKVTSFILLDWSNDWFLPTRGSHESQALAWHAVASWTWDAQDETCGICRMPFDGCCPDCKLPGDDCPLIWGACNHSFHLHCILKWVNSQTSQAHCPMCRREWQFKE
ncbi:anaphase-promoting complex subunit 11-like [Brassica napus]|uniref:anaphase-promoting complex subunit 11-like n=1 Tax=Brassica napus TaxID=3708 RepID=UPI0020790E0E|nr:anaphase-promoting complex subunit 11-like [Brassica napus]